MIQNEIFQKLERLGVVALLNATRRPNAAVSKSSGFMDLNYNYLYQDEEGVVISLTHYFKQNGDLCCDPDMEIQVNLAQRTAEAMSFQQAIPPIYQRVLDDDGNKNPRLQSDLNQFLKTWMGNCISQGHKFNPPA
jgi:hypothetical protein